MVKLSALCLFAASLLAGCTKPNNATCADDYCQDETLPFCDKDGFLEGTANTCIAVDCTPNELVACHTASEAYYCNATGNDINISPCANGCDEAMGGCIDEIIVEEECIANTIECDGNVVKRCSAEGVLSVEACDVSCVSDPEPHCAYLEPKYLPDICDVPATGHVDFGPFDTNIDSQCTGGIVAQVDGPEICVVRAATITIPTGVTATVTGARALALVTDEKLQIDGVLDISANGAVSGPGGGVPLWEGGDGTDDTGGGGGGFQGPGGSGGNDAAAGGAANGGASRALASARFEAGQGQHPMIGAQATAGGAGGGAILIACRGVVELTGVVDAGGGGGLGAIDIDNRVNTVALGGGGGGGSGGHVALQGLAVSVVGRLYANGGSGGTGAVMPNPLSNPVRSMPGKDGLRSTAPAVTAVPTSSSAGTGGAGGAISVGAQAGGIGNGTVPDGSGGGGGGAVGYLEVCLPDGVTPALAVTEVSPALSPTSRVSVR